MSCASKRRDETTVIGSSPSVTAGEWLVAEGWWVRDKEHGLQFKATSMKTVPPTTTDGIERYLGSGLVKGTLNDPRATELITELRRKGYEPGWAHELEIPGKQNPAYQVVYDDDGRYFRIADRVRDLALIAQRR